MQYKILFNLLAGWINESQALLYSSLQQSIDYTLPVGTESSYQDAAMNQTNVLERPGFAFIFATVLVYVVLISLFKRLVYPLVVIFSVPYALIGTLPAIALATNALTVFSIIGTYYVACIFKKEEYHED